MAPPSWPLLDDEWTVVPANEASFDDVAAIFGTRGDPAYCFCQRYKAGDLWGDTPPASRAHRLREQTECGIPDAEATSGLVGYLDGTPVGWCAVEPRTQYARLLRMPVPWKGRYEDRSDESVWAVTCFVIRVGFRRRGVSRRLAAATVDYARSRGATALEGYPMITTPGQEVTWGELHVGARSIFTAAGFTQVSHPTKRRVVMRLDLQLGGAV